MEKMVTIEQFAALGALIIRVLPQVVAKLPNIEETLRLAGGDSREKLADGLLETLFSLTGETSATDPVAAIRRRP